MDEINEIVQTIELLQDELDDLLVRGLRAVDAATLARLRAARDEFRRIAAEHIATRLEELVTAIENDDPGAARALLQAQTSLRLFERVLSLDVAVMKLRGLVESVAACEQKATA
jgi:hypothetical protein